MPGPEALVRRLEWDTAHFGLPIASLTTVEPAEVERGVAQSRADGIRMLIARCAADRVPLVHALEEAGFRLMTTSAHYRCVLRDRKFAAGAGVRPFEPRDLEPVSKVASGAFRGFFGHFHTDPKLDRDRCDALYVEWARNSCRDPKLADAVLVAEMEGEVRGFLTLKRSGDGAEAVLVAVEPGSQGQGMSQAMLASAMVWCRERDIPRLEVASQLANFAAQRAWERAGFEIDGAWHTFHRWQEGRP